MMKEQEQTRMSSPTKETLLVYNMQNTSKGKLLKLICMQLGIRVRVVEKEEFLQPIGYLAGLKGVEPSEERFDGEGFDDEMLILSGFTSNRMDLLFGMFRRQKMERIALKAVVTEHNWSWDSIRLHDELRQEHEYMRQNRKD